MTLQLRSLSDTELSDLVFNLARPSALETELAIRLDQLHLELHAALRQQPRPATNPTNVLLDKAKDLRVQAEELERIAQTL